MFDVRNELERLPDPILYDVARNKDAASRLLAIRILCARGSEYTLRPEIAGDVEKYALDQPERVGLNNTAAVAMNAEAAKTRKTA